MKKLTKEQIDKDIDHALILKGRREALKEVGPLLLELRKWSYDQIVADELMGAVLEFKKDIEEKAWAEIESAVNDG